uniref:Peptidase S1 domain-containing protein n=1 Tax=Panagrolaimus sp. JU765 TaxID=591449 RepID=A0AC34RFQ4_9BILA
MLAKLLFLFFSSSFSVLAFEDVCGVAPNVKKYEKLFENGDPQRILGGHPAKYGDWPWLINVGGICTGSIIHPQWALCAKHCQTLPGVKIKEIRYGTVKKNRGKVMAVTETFMLDDSDKLDNEDIILLKLAEPIKFTSKVHAICLAANISHESGVQNAVAGWGRDEHTHKNREHAYENSVPIRPNEYCDPRGKYNFDKEFCAGSLEHGTTGGDSGGPIMALKNGRWFLHGITSKGFYRRQINGTLEDHGVYTDATAYCDWIEEKTNGDVKCQDDVYEK